MTREEDVPGWKAEAWRGGLLAWVLGLLAFETLTGLTLWLLPFSVANQVAMLLHVGVGLVFMVPFAWFQARHWWYNRDAGLSHVSLTGYFSLLATAAAVVTGVVLAGQALFGRAVGPWWDFAHLAATVGVLASVTPHLVIDLWRNGVRLGGSLSGARERIRAAAGSALLRAVGIVAVLGTVVGAVASTYPSGERGGSARAASAADSARLAGSPFAPSLARSASGETVPADRLGGSTSCGASGCHRQIYREWQPSAHRYSALDTAFQAVQGLMRRKEGARATRYCAGCHDPISLMAGTKRSGQEHVTHPVGRDEGVSCMVCHAADSVDVRGNGDYVLDPPARYLFWEEEGPARTLYHFLIRAYPDQHRESLQPRLLKTPEFCGGCHKQFVPPELTGSGWVGLQNQYDNWRQSRWNHPGEAGETVQCRECHMPLVDSRDPAAGDRADYNRSADDGKHRSHRFLGGNQFIPVAQDLEGGEKHARLTEEWLRGEIEIPEIDEKWTDGPAVPVELDAPRRVAPGDTVALRVRLVNNKPGHKFPTGPLDLLESWVQVVVTGRDGDTVYHAGLPEADGGLDRDDFVFRARPVDANGEPILHHELWKLVGIRWARAVYPGFSDRQTFRFAAPASAGDELRVEAELRYRKFNPAFVDFLEGEGGELRVPVTTLSRAVRSVRVAPAGAGTAAADSGTAADAATPSASSP